jgi:hypothetical protein
VEKMAFIKAMKDKIHLGQKKNNLHKGDEGQDPLGLEEKWPS